MISAVSYQLINLATQLSTHGPQVKLYLIENVAIKRAKLSCSNNLICETLDYSTQSIGLSFLSATYTLWPLPLARIAYAAA